MPRQDSVTAQLQTVAEKARERNFEVGALWIEEKRGNDQITPEGFQLLCRIAVYEGCYDAHDALKRRYGVE
jgi:hypothetical protein